MPGIDTKPESGPWTRRLLRFFRKSRPGTEFTVFAKSEKGCVFETLAVAPKVRASVHDDGLAILDISTGKLFLTNEIGSQIWQGIVAGLTMDAIAEKISRDCGVAWELVRRHITSFLLELEGRGLVIRRLEYHP